MSVIKIEILEYYISNQHKAETCAYSGENFSPLHAHVMASDLLSPAMPYESDPIIDQNSRQDRRDSIGNRNAIAPRSPRFDRQSQCDASKITICRASRPTHNISTREVSFLFAKRQCEAAVRAMDPGGIRRSLP